MRLIYLSSSGAGYDTALSNEDCMPRFFGSFIPKFGDLDLRLGVAGHVSFSNLFFKSAGR
jgi:hypothetical protein